LEPTRNSALVTLLDRILYKASFSTYFGKPPGILLEVALDKINPL